MKLFDLRFVIGVAFACAVFAVVAACPAQAQWSKSSYDLYDGREQIILTIMTPELARILGGHTYIDKDAVSACPLNLQPNVEYLIELNWLPRVGCGSDVCATRTERSVVKTNEYGTAPCLIVHLDPVTERADANGYKTRLHRMMLVWGSELR